MEKKDLYLSDEQYRNLVGYIPIPEHDLRRVSQASADYAVKKVMEELEKATEYARLEDIFSTLFYFKEDIRELIET